MKMSEKLNLVGTGVATLCRPIQSKYKTPHKPVGVVRLYLLRKFTTRLCGVNFFILRTTHPSAFGCHLPSQGKAFGKIALNNGSVGLLRFAQRKVCFANV